MEKRKQTFTIFTSALMCYLQIVILKGMHDKSAFVYIIVKLCEIKNVF